MPGHRIDDRAAVERSVAEIWQLVREHDVLFLLTDSRESRWLPTVLGAAEGKTVLTIALGFDSFVAMRHGSAAGAVEARLGCYFCHDMHAPGDTIAHRTLDQQCTVTRPGVSYLASAVGVELLASILQHPLGNDAPPTSTLTPLEPLPDCASILGTVPHQIRGYLSHFQNMQLVGEAFSACTACSPPILQSVRRDGAAFILRALEEPAHAALVSGAAALQAPVGAAEVELEAVAGAEGPSDDFCLL